MPFWRLLALSRGKSIKSITMKFCSFATKSCRCCAWADPRSKALDDHTFSTDLVSGASILGDGRVVLILNLPAVVEHVAHSRPQEIGQANSGLLLTHTDRVRLALTPTVGSQA